jgi:fido (protein-threonine AMPylation protein)
MFIVKLKEVFLPHPFYHVSGLLLKIFSIWLAHALGSGIDFKNNKNTHQIHR